MAEGYAAAPQGGPDGTAIMSMAHGDSDDEGADVDDSDFGLSDAQLDDLWQRFDTSVVECLEEQGGSFSMNHRGSEDDADDSRDYDAEFGLSDVQLKELRWRSRTLDSSSSEVVATNAKDESPEPAVKPRRRSSVHKVEDFLAMELPALTGEAKAPEKMPFGSWRVVVVSTRDVRGASWYLLRMIAPVKTKTFGGPPTITKYVMKQHADLRTLDETLGWVVGSRKNVTMPPFPEAGAADTGVKQWLGLGSSQVKRKKLLQTYLDGLCSQIPPPTDEPVLGDFFGIDAFE